MSNTQTQTGAGNITAAQFVPPTHIELQLGTNPDFTRRGFGRKVTKVGGRFSHARGDASYRFVTIPVAQFELFDELLRTFPGGLKETVVVFRGGDCNRFPAWVNVQYVPRTEDKPFEYAVHKFCDARENAINRNTIFAA